MPIEILVSAVFSMTMVFKSGCENKWEKFMENLLYWDLFSHDDSGSMWDLPSNEEI